MVQERCVSPDLARWLLWVICYAALKIKGYSVWSKNKPKRPGLEIHTWMQIPIWPASPCSLEHVTTIIFKPSFLIYKVSCRVCTTGMLGVANTDRKEVCKLKVSHINIKILFKFEHTWYRDIIICIISNKKNSVSTKCLLWEFDAEEIDCRYAECFNNIYGLLDFWIWTSILKQKNQFSFHCSTFAVKLALPFSNFSYFYWLSFQQL